MAKETFVAGVITVGMVGAFALGAFTGYVGGTDTTKPKEVYISEVNGDNKPDVMIRDTNNKTFVYLGGNSPLCTKLEDVEAEKVKRVIDRAEQIMGEGEGEQ